MLLEPIWVRNMQLIEIIEINVFYGDVQVIWDLSMAVSKGEIISIVGSNGAGKTTILKTISGLLRPRSGEIKYKGQNVLSILPSDLVAMGVAHIPERRRLFPDLTTLDNLELGAYTRRGRVKKNKNLGKVLDLFPILEKRKKQDAGTLSGGEQQMLAIARGLMAEPEVLMLDEPSLGLAPLITKEIFGIVEQINKNEGVTIMVVDQNVTNALRVADRGYILENGRIANEGECSVLLKNEQLKKAYLGT